MLVIFSNVAVIFALVAVGFIANRRDILPSSITPYLTRLLLNITLPAFILISVTENILTPQMIGEIKQVSIIMVGIYTLGIPFCLLAAKLLRFPKESRGLYAAMLLFTNSGFMGLPIAFAVFKQHGLFIMVFENMFMTLFMYSVGVILIGLGISKKIEWKEALKSVANYCMLASIVGVIMLFAGITFPKPAADFLHLIGEMTVPLSMMLVGIQLGASNLSQLIRKPDLIVFTIVKSSLLPAATLLFMYFIDVSPMVKVITVLCMALPAAAIIVALSEKNGADTSLAAGGVSLSTLFSMISIPLICTLLMGLFL